MIEGFPQTKKNVIRFLAGVGSLLISSGLFLVIPLTQSLDDFDKDIVEYRAMQVALPPPPAFEPPPEDTNRILEEIESEPPVMEQPLEDIPVQQLEFSLAPGMGVALAMGTPNIPVVQKMNVVADIERIFNFDELVRVPTLLNAQMIRADFPSELARRGIKQATIHLEILIDKTGRVKVEKIISASHDHPKLREAAKKAASQARFSISKINGDPVTVRGRFPITLQAPR